MTIPNEETFKDIKKLREVAKMAGITAEEAKDILENPNWDAINDPENPYRKMGKK